MRSPKEERAVGAAAKHGDAVGPRVSAIIASIVAPGVGAHAILNASNPDVGLGSGVSGAIREACGGISFQQEVHSRLAEEFDAPLEQDDCLSTSGGTSTAFRWVLHVPAVNYRLRDPETGGASGPTRVYRCTSAALEEARHLARTNELSGEFVLAVPLLGAGHGGLGAVASADAMMRAVHDTNTGEEVAEVRFAVLDQPTFHLIEHAARKYGLVWRDATANTKA